MWGLSPKSRLQDRYQFIGFISSGTYGRVYKAVSLIGVQGDFAIKKYVYCYYYCYRILLL